MTKEAYESAFPNVDDAAFSCFTYGVEVLTTRSDSSDTGCLVNTAGQIAAGYPRKVSVSLIKDNFTCHTLLRSRKFNLSVLTEHAPYPLFQRFGFQSGWNTDKFRDDPYETRLQNGIRYLADYTNAVLSCSVTDILDIETQFLFLADVTEAHILSAVPSCSYAYYRAKIRPLILAAQSSA